jgi:hypothetical protein
VSDLSREGDLDFSLDYVFYLVSIEVTVSFFFFRKAVWTLTRSSNLKNSGSYLLFYSPLGYFFIRLFSRPLFELARREVLLLLPELIFYWQV